MAAPNSEQGTQEPAAWKWEESDDSTVAYSVMAMVLAAGALPPVQVKMCTPGGGVVATTWCGHLAHMISQSHSQANQLADLPYFTSLALATMYIGAHRGLTTNQRQMISLKEGALAPILASVSLFVCYLIVKYLPNLSLQTFLNCYFWLLGSIAALGATGPFLRKVSGPLGKQVRGGSMLCDSQFAMQQGQRAIGTRATLVRTDACPLLVWSATDLEAERTCWLGTGREGQRSERGHDCALRHCVAGAEPGSGVCRGGQ